TMCSFRPRSLFKEVWVTSKGAYSNKRAEQLENVAPVTDALHSQKKKLTLERFITPPAGGTPPAHESDCESASVGVVWALPQSLSAYRTRVVHAGTTVTFVVRQKGSVRHESTTRPPQPGLLRICELGSAGSRRRGSRLECDHRPGDSECRRCASFGLAIPGSRNGAD